MGNSGLGGSYPEAPGESRGCCSLSSSHRTRVFGRIPLLDWPPRSMVMPEWRATTCSNELDSMGPTPRLLERAEAVAHFRLATGQECLGVYLYWIGLSSLWSCQNGGRRPAPMNWTRWVLPRGSWREPRLLPTFV
ncbi:hypothetical protein TNCV_1734041 [Trichonephila clavipes]|nr:hypothetical protein TNCV_1734041 [Trichonephila clavipes]